jgi:hypothetical protein
MTIDHLCEHQKMNPTLKVYNLYMFLNYICFKYFNMDRYELKRLNKHTVLRKDISIKKKLEHLIIHNRLIQ